MFALSTRAKEAIKTALAMTIAYGIALQMDWQNPRWAGFAVAFCSLATIGQSLNKAIMRMLGTLVGAVVALSIIALFPQDRWLFMIGLSAYGALCSYMMCGLRHQYFWNVCGFVCFIIALRSGSDPVNAFQLAILRAQETGLGILVYSLVSILVWPSSSRHDLEAAMTGVLETEHSLFKSYWSLMKGEGDDTNARALKARLIQEQTRFNQLLDAAETEAYEIRESRRAWHQFRKQLTALSEAMERWRESFAEVRSLDPFRLLPNLKAFRAELDERFCQVRRMIAHQAAQQDPTAVPLVIDEAHLASLSHFERASLAVFRAKLRSLETATQMLFTSAASLRGFETQIVLPPPQETRKSRFVFDQDRGVAALRVLAGLWLAYLAYIFIDALPGGPAFVITSGSMSLAMASMPQISVRQLFLPAAASLLFVSVPYFFVMPQLSSYIGLGILIFLATFAICYLFSEPRQALGRVFGLAMFATMASISNQQIYSFLAVANLALIFPLILCLMAVTAYIPYSPRPERAILRLLGRFFRSSAYLISAAETEPQAVRRWLRPLRITQHAYEVSTLPQKMQTWAKFLNTRNLSGTSADQVQTLITNLQGMSYHLQEMLENRTLPGIRSILDDEVLNEARSWRRIMQEACRMFVRDPVSVDGQQLRNELERVMGRLITCMRDHVEREPDTFANRDMENLYRVLGVYHGVSEAAVAYAGLATKIDWDDWREELF